MRLRRLRVLLLLGSALLIGCSTWHDLETPPRADDSVGHARVTMRNMSEIEVQNAHVKGDTLYGQRIDPANRSVRNKPAVALFVPDVLSIEESKTSIGKTGLLVVGLLAGSFAAVAMAFAGSNFGFN